MGRISLQGFLPSPRESLALVVSYAAALAAAQSAQATLSLTTNASAEKAIVASVLLAGRAASEKAMTDLGTKPGTPANLVNFYARLKGAGLISASTQLPKVAELPANLRDPEFLLSFNSSLASRPFIWIPEKKLDLDEFPEAVALIDSSVGPGGQVTVPGACSGTVIGPNAILSAAHCACDLTHAVSVRLKTTNWLTNPGVQLAVSGHRSMLADCSAYQSATVDERRDQVRRAGDVAVFFVKEDIRQYGIQPAVVSDGFKPRSSYYIAGYGISDEDEKPGPRRSATIQGMQCDQARAVAYGCNPAFEFWGDGGKIAGRPDRPDACGGDSGGPVFEHTMTSPATVVGVVSRPINGTSCGQGGIYVALTGPVQQWLKDVLQIAGEPQGGLQRTASVVQQR